MNPILLVTSGLLVLTSSQFTSITDLSRFPFSFAQEGRNWTGECASGTRQSPIDLINTPDIPVTVVTDTSLAFTINTTRQAFQVYEDFGMLLYLGQATIQGRFNATVFDGSLFQFHVHAPADHEIDGMKYPLELHLAFTPTDSSDLQALLVGFFFREGQTNSLLQAIIDMQDFDLNVLLPSDGVIDDYIYYIGSRGAPLPDCVEPQLYLFPNYILEAAPDQIAYFDDRYINDLGFSNGNGDIREIQPLNGRTIYHVQADAEQSSASFLGETD